MNQVSTELGENYLFVKSPSSYLRVRRPLRDHCSTSLGLLWDFYGFLQTCLYNNAAKIFGAEGVLCRRLEKLKVIWIYKASGKCCKSIASRLWCFFEKSFRVPKIVPKKLPAFCIPLVYLWYRIGIASSSAKVAQG